MAHREEASTVEGWSIRLTTAVAAEIRRLRESRQPKMSAQRLSDECARHGHPIPRAVISNLENGERETLTLAELLVLARALNVSPNQLVAPVGVLEAVEILPGRTVAPWHASLWLDGTTMAEGIGPAEDGDAFSDHTRAIALWRRHSDLIFEWEAAGARRRARVVRTEAGLATRPDLSAHDGLEEVSDRYEPLVRSVRDECRSRGIALPPYPGSFAGLIDVPGPGDRP